LDGRKKTTCLLKTQDCVSLCNLQSWHVQTENKESMRYTRREATPKALTSPNHGHQRNVFAMSSTTVANKAAELAEKTLVANPDNGPPLLKAILSDKCVDILPLKSQFMSSLVLIFKQDLVSWSALFYYP
jgi:hypothetical protein